MICKKCLVDRCFIAGQGFTKWTCTKCGKEFEHHNTDKPKICKECSEKYNLCEKCGESIEEINNAHNL